MSKFIVQLLLSFENEPLEDNNVLLFLYTRIWNQLKKGNMVAENRELSVVENSSDLCLVACLEPLEVSISYRDLSSE